MQTIQRFTFLLSRFYCYWSSQRPSASLGVNHEKILKRGFRLEPTIFKFLACAVIPVMQSNFNNEKQFVFLIVLKFRFKKQKLYEKICETDKKNNNFPPHSILDLSYFRFQTAFLLYLFEKHRLFRISYSISQKGKKTSGPKVCHPRNQELNISW